MSSVRPGPARMPEFRQSGPLDSVSLGPRGSLAQQPQLEELWAQALPGSAVFDAAALAVTARNLAMLTFDWLIRAFPDSEESDEKLLEALLTALRVFSPHSVAHSNRVADLAGALAEELDLPDFQAALQFRDSGLVSLELALLPHDHRHQLAEDIRSISLHEAGRIHDIGKLHVPPGILTKAGPLTDEERALVRLHPVLGESMLRRFHHLARILPAVRGHHERWDGQGYPDEIARADIPLSARLLCLADSYDAMTGRRPYREPYTIPEALQDILRNSGSQFDPELTGLFVRMVARQLT